jgi:hypothetical protein
VLGEDVRDIVGEIEAAAVGVVAEGFDLGNAGEALLQQVVFEGQIELLWMRGKQLLSPIAQRGRMSWSNAGANGGVSEIGLS